jgi:hypothetical protein
MKKLALLCGILMSFTSIPAHSETMRYGSDGRPAEKHQCFWASKKGAATLFVCAGGPSQLDIHDYPGWGTLYERCVQKKPLNEAWLDVCEAQAFKITRERAAHGIIPSDADRVLD